MRLSRVVREIRKRPGLPRRPFPRRCPARDRRSLKLWSYPASPLHGRGEEAGLVCRLQLRLTINGDPGRVGALNEWTVGHSEVAGAAVGNRWGLRRFRSWWSKDLGECPKA